MHWKMCIFAFSATAHSLECEKFLNTFYCEEERTLEIKILSTGLKRIDCNNKNNHQFTPLLYVPLRQTTTIQCAAPHLESDKLNMISEAFDVLLLG